MKLPPPDALDEIIAGIMDHGTNAGLVKDKGAGDDLLDLELGPLPPPKPPQVEAKPPPVKEAQEVIRFECPSCGTAVDAAATKCPQCGVIFSDSDHFDCPVCGSLVSFDAVQCPACGVKFVEDTSAVPPLGPQKPFQTAAETSPATEPLDDLDLELGGPPRRSTPAPAEPRRATPPSSPSGGPALAAPAAAEGRPAGPSTPLQQDIPSLITEIKGLLALGKSLGMPFDNQGRAITEATRFAKSGDMGRALRMMGRAKEAIKASVAANIRTKLSTMPPNIQTEGMRLLGAGDLRGAASLLTRPRTAGQAGGAARHEVERARVAVKEAQRMGFPVPECQELLGRTLQALNRADDSSATILARQCNDRAQNAIRDGLAEEVKKARNLVFELKMKGERVDKPIELLKLASNCLKDNDFPGAFQYLQAFRREVPRNSR
jgi:hypothetical protein